LAERHDVAFHRLQRLQRGALRRHQLMSHGKKIFGDDVQAGMRHQVVDVRDPSGN
jgi:hypothetical protein